jgi:hypothetical protein
MGRVLAVLVVALLVAGAGCAQDEDSSTDWATIEAIVGRTPTPAPGTWGALAYDQKHSICQEAASTMKETVTGLGREPGRAESMFYDRCMACGGPTEVLAHADPDWLLIVECRTEDGSPKSIPEDHRRIWP